MKLILGSQSEPRKKVLEETGFSFGVVAPDIDEKAIRFENPQELVLALGNAKADAVASKLTEPAIIITSDQVISHKGKIIEKPENAPEAAALLKAYESDTPALTVTSVVVTNSETGERKEGVDIAEVWFKPIPDTVIDQWIQSGKAFKHAGGFAVEDPILEPFVDHLVGEPESIAGLPKALTLRLLKEIGYEDSSVR